ncbi:hypothetical protein JI735_22330 [Paenibacillus sonchi]|uniref:Uncharacterized protein n=2 Tax=Paenibacillus sonchi group TaxID=2044880 RepID=A0A974SCL7_9BACL|nr:MULTISPECIES: hypothetical protein [Paenibacillus sonchi group]MCE3200416.1 hypothetical protein [Paenibacillus sonchi]QQZ59380.1 hypothetical protein JI735_22330 [Paenibacillus sonchi]CQR55131.1 hypothetical protein PRIO_2727 [Paenibacillus riograndensis SBR5]
MSDHIKNEADIRNKESKKDDSLAERKKMENGVDIEPEADDWVAKPADTSHPDPFPKS